MIEFPLYLAVCALIAVFAIGFSAGMFRMSKAFDKILKEASDG